MSKRKTFNTNYVHTQLPRRTILSALLSGTAGAAAGALSTSARALGPTEIARIYEEAVRCHREWLAADFCADDLEEAARVAAGDPPASVDWSDDIKGFFVRRELDGGRIVCHPGQVNNVRHRLLSPLFQSSTTPELTAKLRAVVDGYDQHDAATAEAAKRLGLPAARAAADAAQERSREAEERLIEARATTLADLGLKAKFVCVRLWGDDTDPNNIIPADPHDHMDGATDRILIASILSDLMAVATEGGAA